MWILGHTQQGVQSMLRTECRSMFLLLMIYTIGECLETGHVFLPSGEIVIPVLVVPY